MKGITPVIAIILLLLMAVAAAGGFYFVYQQFSQSGEQSGSTQIEQLGETALAQIKVESIANGKVYIRNTGATDIDMSKISVFVDNVPYEFGYDDPSLSEGERATLSLTSAPSCAGSTCKIKISGITSATASAQPSDLVNQIGYVSIVSITGGTITIQNTGTTTISLSSLLLSLEGSSLSFTSNSSTMAPGETAVLFLEEVPSCSGSCILSIGGAASETETVTQTDLECESDDDCSGGATCDEGLCVPETATCGDGVCSPGEYAYSCFSDCHPPSFISASFFTDQMKAVDWVDGNDTYAFGETIEPYAGANDLLHGPPSTVFGPGNIAVSGGFIDHNSANDIVVYSYYDGSAWTTANFTQGTYNTAFRLSMRGYDMDSSGNAMFVWSNNLNQTLGWGWLANGAPAAPTYLESFNANYGPHFKFTGGGNGFMFYSNISNGRSIQYKFWDGSSWGTEQVIQDYPNATFNVDHLYSDFAANGDGMLVWHYNAANSNNTVSYAAYDGSAWSFEGNITDAEYSVFASPIYDQHNVPLMLVVSGIPLTGSNVQYYTRVERYVNGAWNRWNNEQGFYGYLVPHTTYDGTTIAHFVGEYEENYNASKVSSQMAWQDYWTYWDGNRFVTPTLFGS